MKGVMVGGGSGGGKAGAPRAAQNGIGHGITTSPAVIRTQQMVIPAKRKFTLIYGYFFSTCAPGVTWMLFVVRVVPVAR